MQLELKTLQAEVGSTFVYVTHDQEEALTMSDRVALMKDGQIEQIGRPEDIYNRPASVYAADFIGDANSLSGTVDTASGSTCVLKLDGGERVTATTDHDLKSGVRAHLILRPERCSLVDPEDGLVRGRVLDSLFRGHTRAVVLEMDRDTTLTAAVADQESHAASLTPGTEFGVRWAVEDAWVVGE
jgi:ABC-type Fe3+/spermidine/putrescine transport system ATPase subunit